MKILSAVLVACASALEIPQVHKCPNQNLRITSLEQLGSLYDQGLAECLFIASFEGYNGFQVHLGRLNRVQGWETDYAYHLFEPGFWVYATGPCSGWVGVGSKPPAIGPQTQAFGVRITMASKSDCVVVEGYGKCVVKIAKKKKKKKKYSA
eukprot:Trichotokara_eunicae@DN1573_c0_g1_i1.p1